MPGLHSVAGVATDVLVPGLSLSLPNTASYVLGRKFTTCWPQGSNVYSPTVGQRLIRFVISDSTQFVDLSTLRLAFTLTNAPNRAMYATGDPGACWFQRCRIYIAGTLVEDINFYNRVSSMMRLCKSPHRLWAESIELLGQTSDNIDNVHWKAHYCGGPSNAEIPGNSRQTIVTPIHAGLFKSHYLLPGRFPLTIELELVADPGQCCPAGADRGANPATANLPGLFSQDFTITNARILVDMVQTDVAIQNTFTEALAAGRPMQLALSSYSTTMHSLTLAGNADQSWDISLSRAYSRIKDVWVTYDNNASRGVWNTESNNFLSWHGKGKVNEYGNSGVYDPRYGEGFRFQMSCGALQFPDLPVNSHKEQFYQLSKVVGMHSSTEGVSIPPGEYLGRSHIAAFDLEKLYSSPGAAFVRFTGLNTQSAGDTLRFAWQNVTISADAFRPSRVYITLHYDLVVELRQEGALTLD